MQILLTSVIGLILCIISLSSLCQITLMSWPSCPFSGSTKLLNVILVHIQTFLFFKSLVSA